MVEDKTIAETTKTKTFINLHIILAIRITTITAMVGTIEETLTRTTIRKLRSHITTTGTTAILASNNHTTNQIVTAAMKTTITKAMVTKATRGKNETLAP
jgi:hypothetical protein